ncbi:interferon regulatory factor 3 isoform 1-T1 [Acanthopagrus schlegelii]
MSHSKPLLIPWLRARINSSKYPGVQWTNPERTEFSIPWKHALRQDSSDNDILIFKAWAEVSGNGQAQGDPSIWKRNFRSALRVKGFKMVRDNKNDTAFPHKVFLWPEESASGANSSAGSQDQDDLSLFEDVGFPIQESQMESCLDDCLYLADKTLFVDSAASHDILQESLKGLNIGPDTEGTVGFEPPPEQQQLQNQLAIGGCALPGQQQHPVTFESAVGEAGLPEQPARPMEGAMGGACGGQLAEQFLQAMNRTSGGDNFKTQFRISVYYRGVKVSEQLVENEAGIRLVYRPELMGTVVDPASGLSLVSLPSPTMLVDQTQVNLTQRILDKLGNGVDFGVSGHVFYGQRHGEVKAFWSFSKHDSIRTPQEISKLEPQLLYTFKDFVQGILNFIASEGGESPPCILFFCLGEKWPDPHNKPWERKLVTVEVVLTSMELLKNMAVVGGASSLQSVELQMSLEEMMEMY